jgi:hypothetical protein
MVRGTYFNPREPTVSKRRDSVAKQSYDDEYKKALVCFVRKDADTRFRLKNVQTCSEKLCRAKVHRESN